MHDPLLVLGVLLLLILLLYELVILDGVMQLRANGGTHEVRMGYKFFSTPRNTNPNIVLDPPETIAEHIANEMHKLGFRMVGISSDVSRVVTVAMYGDLNKLSAAGGAT